MKLSPEPKVSFCLIYYLTCLYSCHKIFVHQLFIPKYRRRWLLSVGAYSFSQQENERLTANMRLIGIPMINMGGVIIILWNTAGEALNKYTIKPTAK